MVDHPRNVVVIEEVLDLAGFFHQLGYPFPGFEIFRVRVHRLPYDATTLWIGALVFVLPRKGAIRDHFGPTVAADKIGFSDHDFFPAGATRFTRNCRHRAS